MDKDKPKKPEGIFLTIGSKQKKSLLGQSGKMEKKRVRLPLSQKKKKRSSNGCFLKKESRKPM